VLQLPGVSQEVLAEKRLIAGNRTDPRATAFRMLCTQVIRENNWTSIRGDRPDQRRRQGPGCNQPCYQYLA
jgi:hypothetical protein